MSKLFIGGVPSGTSREELMSIFERFGVKAMDVKENGFAFCEMTTAAGAEDALRSVPGTKVRDSTLRVELARGSRDGNAYVATSSRGPPRRSEFRVRVHNLVKGASWQDLKDFMRPAGEPGFAQTYQDSPDGETYGIVEFPTRDGMEYALTKLNGAPFTNRFGEHGSVKIVQDDPAAPIPPRDARTDAGNMRRDPYPPGPGFSSRGGYGGYRDDMPRGGGYGDRPPSDRNGGRGGGYYDGPPRRDDYYSGRDNSRREDYGNEMARRDDYHGRDRGGHDYHGRDRGHDGMRGQDDYGGGRDNYHRGGGGEHRGRDDYRGSEYRGRERSRSRSPARYSAPAGGHPAAGDHSHA